jgi:hypothetical protein
MRSSLRRAWQARYSACMAIDLKANVELSKAVERARAQADADGSLHPSPGEAIDTTREFREAIKTLIDDGTYDDAVAALTAADPDLG